MRILIGYDGSAYADAALDDLRRAGLPRVAEALIVSVGDGLVDTASLLAEVAGAALTSRRVTSAIALAREQAMRLLEEARGFAAEARGRVLIEEARKRRVDCVFVGARGVGGHIEDTGLGSVSTRLVTGAHCSVEVVR